MSTFADADNQHPHDAPEPKQCCSAEFVLIAEDQWTEGISAANIRTLKLKWDNYVTVTSKTVFDPVLALQVSGTVLAAVRDLFAPGNREHQRTSQPSASSNEGQIPRSDPRTPDQHLLVHPDPPPEVLHRILGENHGDLMSLGMFTDYVSAHMRVGGEDLRNSVLRLLERALSNGHMAIGSLTDIRHVPWAVSPTEALERIAKQWPETAALGYPELEAIAWLSNTPEGDQAGEKWSGRVEAEAATNADSTNPPGCSRPSDGDALVAHGLIRETAHSE